MKNRRKTKSLLVRVTVISLILGAAAMLVSGFTLYTIIRGRAEENMGRILREQVYAMNDSLIEYQSIGWLMSYWREHHAEMSLPPFPGADDYTHWLEERGEFERRNVAGVTTEEVLEMSEERQRLFAEYCYLKIFLALALARAQGEVDVVSCFVPNETGEDAFAVFRSTQEDKGLVEQRMVLGEAWDFRPEEHPSVMALYAPDSELHSGIEYSRSPEDGTDYASVYTLIWHDRKPYGVTCVSMSMREMMAGVWSDVFSFEKWVALIILIALLTMLFTLYLTTLKPALRLAQDIRFYTQSKSAETLSKELEDLISRGDEIGMLAGDVMEMVARNELYFQQKVENETLKIKILMAQIKPHFIFNCLTVIRSFMDEPQKAEDALNHFAGFLRGSVDMLEVTECIRAEQEFKTVDDYLYMQKQRFEDQLRVVTDYRDRSFFLPAFSLQILVENAVDHGIRGTRDGRGTVWIRSYATDGFHVIEVEDDGAGIPPEGFTPVGPEEQLHVGLKNIEKRLEMMCRGTLTIQSTEGKGTVATIRIPKEA